MGVLRDRMVREMQLREFSASTQKLYLATLTDLAKYHHQSPDTLDPTQIQNFLLYLTQERHLAWSSVSVAASAIRFFYTHTLKRLDLAMAMPSRRKPRRLPHILSVEEVERVLLMTTYAAGLRVSEVVRLQFTDRSTILSPRLLTELDRYRAQRSLTRWLVPARMGEQPASTSTAQHVFIAAKVRAGIQKPGSIHLLPRLRHPSSGNRRRPPDHPGVAGPRVVGHHEPLSPRHAQDARCRPESVRSPDPLDTAGRRLTRGAS